MTEPKERIGNPCPDRGGCNTYCADCTDPIPDHLRVLETAAREVRDSLIRGGRGGYWVTRPYIVGQLNELAAKLDAALETEGE